MKSFILGFITCLIVSITSTVVWQSFDREKNPKIHNTAWFLKNSVFEGAYLIDPITGRCSTKPVRMMDDPSKVTTQAEWFDCDKFQRSFNIEKD